MGSKEAKKNNQLVDQERSRGVKEHETTMGYMQPERHAAKEMADKERADIYGRYSKFAEGNFGGAGGSGSSGGGGGGPAGISGTLEDAKNRYKTFADTGGYTDIDKTNIRQRGIAPISGMFGGLQRTMEQKRAAGQSSNIGFGDSLQRMAREQARAGATASRDTELGIMDRVNEGKRFGLEGYTGIGNTETELAARNSAEGGANERFNRGLQMDATNRMADLYGSSPGELSRYDTNLAGERGMASNQFQSSNQQRMNYNPNVSKWDRAMQIGGLVAGGASSLTGLGALGGAGKALGKLGKAKIPMMPGRGGASIPGITANPFGAGQSVNPGWQDRIRF